MVGLAVFVRGFHSFRTMNLNMFSLIAMGTGAAYLFSIVAVLVPDIFPDGFRDGEGRVGVYFEAAAVIVTLVLLGQIMELRARERTGSAIKALLDMAAKTAGVIRPDGTGEEIALEDVQVGDHYASGPAIRCRSMALCWMVALRWMRSWCRANQYRLRRSPGMTLRAPPLTARGVW